MISPNDWKVFEFHPGICYTEPGDSMYNQEIKERFLEEYDNVAAKKRFLTGLFSNLESCEENAQKDIAEMNRDEVVDTIETLSAEISTVQQILSILRKYVSWCKSNMVFPKVSDDLLELTAKDFDFADALEKSLFRNEFDFLTTLKSVREFNEGYPEPPALCLAWLGLKTKEILALTDDDVDMEKQTITVDNQVVVAGFPDAIAEVLQQYIGCKVSERDHRTGWRQVIKDYSTGMFLKKMLPRGNKEFGKPYGYSQITAAVSKLNARLVEDGKPGRLKFDNVWNSGRYYKLWETEQSGIDVTKPANRPIVEEILRSSKSYYNAIRMYKAYKKAFDLENKIPAQK